MVCKIKFYAFYAGSMVKNDRSSSPLFPLATSILTQKQCPPPPHSRVLQNIYTPALPQRIFRCIPRSRAQIPCPPPRIQELFDKLVKNGQQHCMNSLSLSNSLFIAPLLHLHNAYFCYFLNKKLRILLSNNKSISKLRIS